MTSKTLLTAAASLAAIGAIPATVTAQTTPTHVRPAFHATHEGNGTFTYPFGRGPNSSGTIAGRAGVQTILESTFVTSQPTALIAALYFRHDGEDFTDAWTGFTQDVTVLMASVPTSPQMMTGDVNVGNLGGATPVTFFSGPLNVPASAAQPLAPRPFSIAIFPAAPFTYNATNAGTLQHLLIDIRVTPLAANQNINIDTVLYRSAYIEGDQEAYTTDCANLAGESLRYIPSKANLLVGGSVDGSLTSRLGTTSTPGLFPGAMVAFGASSNPIDLSVIGTNGCWWSPALDITAFFTDTGSGFSALSFPIPNDAALADAYLYTQAFGLAANLSLADSVTSEAYWLKLGPMPSTSAYWPFATYFDSDHTDPNWTPLNNTGPYGIVIGFSGSL